MPSDLRSDGCLTASAASLQAKLDAIPTPLAVAEEQVRREVTWAEYEPKRGPLC
jgi:hypothetical protein